MVVGIPGMNIPTNPRPTHDQPTIKRINFLDHTKIFIGGESGAV